MSMHKDDRSNSYIASHLSISRTTVRMILARYDSTGSPLSGSRSGRPRCTDEALDTVELATALRPQRRLNPSQARATLV